MEFFGMVIFYPVIRFKAAVNGSFMQKTILHALSGRSPEVDIENKEGLDEYHIVVIF